MNRFYVCLLRLNHKNMFMIFGTLGLDNFLCGGTRYTPLPRIIETDYARNVHVFNSQDSFLQIHKHALTQPHAHMHSSTLVCIHAIYSNLPDFPVIYSTDSMRAIHPIETQSTLIGHSPN